MKDGEFPDTYTFRWSQAANLILKKYAHDMSLWV